MTKTRLEAERSNDQIHLLCDVTYFYRRRNSFHGFPQSIVSRKLRVTDGC